MSFLLQGGLGDTVDFAFIDADKANYSGYIQLCHKLLRPGGLLALDNTLFRVGLIYLYIPIYRFYFAISNKINITSLKYTTCILSKRLVMDV